MRKQPRDFVHVDALWEADGAWPHYFLEQQVWIFVDEYRAELSGDEDYSRILIHSGEDEGWLFSRPLTEKPEVDATLDKIKLPVSELQLKALGFTAWKGQYI